MKRSACSIITTFCTLAAGDGCTLETSEPDPREATTMAEIIVTNGASINGASINGVSINGAPGTEVVYGRSVSGTSAGGGALSGLTLQGSELSTVRVSDGAVLSGTAFIGATFITQIPDSSPIALRIDAHAASPSEHHTGSIVNHYALSYRPSGATAWTPVCGELDHAPVLAIPLVGRWNYAQGVPGGGARLEAPDWITFACSGFGLYKCVKLGYEPWTSAGVGLGGHHQACLRAHRADYCGDGRSYTADGHFINIFDNLGIEGDTESWSREAEWDVNGARCLSRPRIAGGTAPDCALSRCDTSPGWPNTLIVTEAP